VAGRDPGRGRHRRGRVPACRRPDQEPGRLPARPASRPPSRVLQAAWRSPLAGRGWPPP
jgi:hypothetical protein